jgi:hypothetical protein
VATFCLALYNLLAGVLGENLVLPSLITQARREGRRRASGRGCPGLCLRPQASRMGSRTLAPAPPGPAASRARVAARTPTGPPVARSDHPPPNCRPPPRAAPSAAPQDIRGFIAVNGTAFAGCIALFFLSWRTMSKWKMV